MKGEGTRREKGENLVNIHTTDKGIVTIEKIGTTKIVTELGTRTGREIVVEIVIVREIEPVRVIGATEIVIRSVTVGPTVRVKERETGIMKLAVMLIVVDLVIENMTMTRLI